MRRREYLEKRGWRIMMCASQTNPKPVYMAKKGSYTFVGESITDLFNKIMGYKL